MLIKENQLRRIIRKAILQEKNKKGLWANIHSRKVAGKRPKRPGEKGYPKTLDIGETDETPLEESDCWDGYSPGAQTGVKTKKGKGGKRVNNCEPVKKEQDETLEEAFLYHLTANTGFDKNIFRPGSTMFFSLFREARELYNQGLYVPKSTDEIELLESDIGKFAIYENQLVPLDYPIEGGNEEHLNEAEYQGKKVELNKPKGSSGDAYVYVNSGKKDKDGKIKVKKVSFGSSMPSAMGKSPAHKKRRKSFGDRHNCSDKKDKTAAGYWSCRATKFFGRDIAGWW